MLGLVLTIFFATSFTTALARVYQRAWRRPPLRGHGAYWRGAVWLCAQLATMALLGAIRGVLDGSVGLVAFGAAVRGRDDRPVVVQLLVVPGRRGPAPCPARHRGRTALLLLGYVLSATVWMPRIVSSNEEQFGVFGIALALVSWFSGAAICILLGACAGPVLAEDSGATGTWIRGLPARRCHPVRARPSRPQRLH